MLLFSRVTARESNRNCEYQPVIGDTASVQMPVALLALIETDWKDKFLYLEAIVTKSPEIDRRAAVENNLRLGGSRLAQQIRQRRSSDRLPRPSHLNCGDP